MTVTTAYRLGELARLLDVEYSGDPEVLISGLASLDSAATGQLSFFHNPRYLQALLNTRATAVILHPDFAARCPSNCLIAAKPYITFAKATRLFERRALPPAGRHPSAVVDPDARVDPSASIGPHVVIGAGCEIGPRVQILANCSLGADVHIGADSRIYANVSIYDGVVIGERAVIHSAAVLGADGFGFASDGQRHHKIAQLGGLRIGDDVEIGAGSSIDRGALDDTVIENGVKIDNQVQVAHNVRIGANSVLCGCSAVAGSTRIGKNCTIAGGVGIINHLNIADGVTITAMSLVSQSIEQAGLYSSGTGLSDTFAWRRNMLRFRELDDMARRLRRLEKAVGHAQDKAPAAKGADATSNARNTAPRGKGK